MSDIVLSKNENIVNTFVSVRRCLVTRGSKNNILSVQLYNGSDFVVNGVNLRVEYLDHTGGTVCEVREIEINGIMGLPESEFILPDVAVPTTREAVNVKLYSVISGNCLYRICNDGSIESEICTRKNTAAPADEYKTTQIKNKFTAIFAVFVIFLFLISLAVALPGILGQNEESTYNAAEVNIIGDGDAKTRENN